MVGRSSPGSPRTTASTDRRLVAHNPDRAGDFVADAEAAALRLPPGLDQKRIYLTELGTAATRDAILDAFDSGASLMSYIGHGGIHLWADENVFNTSRLTSLAPQPRQPILLTMNCLNGLLPLPVLRLIVGRASENRGERSHRCFLSERPDLEHTSAALAPGDAR